MKTLVILILTAVALVSSSPSVSSKNVSLRTQLTAALTGKDLDPLGTVRRIAELPETQLRLEGITVEDNKAPDYDEVIKIHLSPTLALHGAKTAMITLSLTTGQYKDFRGFVFAEFEGDITIFVASRKLTKRNAVGQVGIYERAYPLHPEQLCPVTLGATPIDSKHFVAGVGWCNG